MSAFRTRSLDDVDLLVCVPLEARGVVNGFTSRVHGFGQRERGESDRARLRNAVRLDDVAHMKQVHGRTVRVLDGDEPSECDGLVTAERGRGVLVQTADCVPLLMWSSGSRTVAAVHAGWRGTLARVASEAVETLLGLEGAMAEGIHVAIGPAIRRCCFEVGDEVVEAFAESGRDLERISEPGPRGRRHLDLIEDNRHQLRALHVPEEHVYDSGICTMCESDRFYSYRREGRGVGRNLGIIGVRKGSEGMGEMRR